MAFRHLIKSLRRHWRIGRPRFGQVRFGQRNADRPEAFAGAAPPPPGQAPSKKKTPRDEAVPGQQPEENAVAGKEAPEEQGPEKKSRPRRPTDSSYVCKATSLPPACCHS